jgi:hypothetical protein
MKAFHRRNGLPTPDGDAADPAPSQRLVSPRSVTPQKFLSVWGYTRKPETRVE